MPIYMKIEGIKGNVTAAGHEGWIELMSAQLGVQRRVNTTGQGANREASTPSVSEIVVTKDIDSASTDLFRMSLWGEGKKVTIDFVSSGQTVPYLSIELENTLISNYSVSGHGGSGHETPMESLSLNFTKISYTTKVTTPPKDPKHAELDSEWRAAVSSIA